MMRRRVQLNRGILTALILLAVAACAVRAPQGSGPRNAVLDAPRETTSATSALNVVSYNIRHGRGMDDRVDISRAAGVLLALTPDIVGVQEVDVGVERSGAVDEAAELGRLTGLQHSFGAFFDYQGGRYGMAILSRFPIRRSESVRLPDGNEPRVALAVEVDHQAIGRLMIVNVHFDWVADDAFRFAQATRLTAFLDSLTIPFVLLGDFNDTPGSRTLALFQARALEAKKHPSDRFTFSSTNPEKEIDFIFAAPARRWTAGAVRVIDERVVSDHRPVAAVLSFASGAR